MGLLSPSSLCFLRTAPPPCHLPSPAQRQRALPHPVLAGPKSSLAPSNTLILLHQ